MRKTLTVISLVLAAGSLAACKMFWEKDQTPPPAAAATTPANADPTATAEAGKLSEQTAAMSSDHPTAPADGKTDSPTVPAQK
jgi:hypothetical protein